MTDVQAIATLTAALTAFAGSIGAYVKAARSNGNGRSHKTCPAHPFFEREIQDIKALIAEGKSDNANAFKALWDESKQTREAVNKMAVSLAEMRGKQ